MSIFKESFRDYVKKQIELRQAIISLGNDGESRFNSRKVNFSAAAGGGTVNIPYGAFFANTLNRTCVIRMSSGADLTQAGVYNVLDQWELNQNITAGADLAKLYILEGGVLDVGDNHDQINYDANGKPTMDWLINAQPKSGWTNAINKKNSAYGDALTRSNSINKEGDDYGIVPMPGIIDAQIKTKSAYGSIREAKVNFKCHNQRQLEILELLYMRPGVPVLLEWGWTTYVNNEGKLISDSSLPTMPSFWNAEGEGGMNTIYRNIITNKEKTGGNYDGLMGMVKNFSFKARKDGGYDCSTELTAMGEIIESLKGRSGTPGYTELVLAPFTVESTGGGPNLDVEVNALGELYDKFKPDEGDLDAFQLILIDLQCYLIMTDEVYGYTWKSKSINNFTEVSLSESQRLKTLWSSSSLNNKEFIQDYVDSLERVFKYFDLDKITDYYTISDTYAATEDKLKSDYITNFLHHHGVRNKMPGYSHEDVHAYLENNEKEVNDGKLNDIDWKGAGWKTGFIKWDAVAYLLNKYAITPLANDSSDNTGDDYESQSNNEPIIKIATKYIQNEPENPGGSLGNTHTSFPETRLRPYTYADVPMKNSNPTGKMYSSTPTGTTKVTWRYPYQMCDRSFDHSVCFLPHGCTDYGGRALGSQYLNYAPFDLMYLSSPKDPKRNKVLEFIKTRSLVKAEQQRSIGNIMFNIDHLINTYQDMAYEKEDNTYIRKDDFSIYKFIETIWSDVNRATGGAHKFLPQVDHEKPDLVRIIDMQTCETDLPDPTKIHQMNIQGNSTIVRDFTYNSLIPSALSATIGIAMQNPDSIDDLDGATFAAMARNIKSRFIENKQIKDKGPTPDEIKKWKEKYEKRIETIGSVSKDLVVFDGMLRIGYGQTEAGDQEAADGRGFTVFEVYSAPTKQKSLYKNMLRIMTYESKDGTYSSGLFSGKKYYKGQPKPAAKMPNASSVIPLKFNAKMDGIGGIVIGNVFTIDPTRLPRGYKGSDIAFVTTGESQKITAGNDWTTTINGQLTLLPFSTPVSTTTATKVSVSGKETQVATPSTVSTTPTTPATPAAGITKLSELKNTTTGGGSAFTPIKDLLSDLEGTDGTHSYGVYNYGTSSKGKHPCSSVKGAKANKDALGKPPINTMTMEEIMRRQALPGRVPDGDGCERHTGTYSDGKDLNGCEIFAAGKYQIIPKTMKSAFAKGIFQKSDIFDSVTQEKLGDYLLTTKRSRLKAYLLGENSGTEDDLRHAVNETGWEWASAPIINFAATKYAKACKKTMSDVMGDVKTGTGNHGNYCDGVNKANKKTFVKNIVINLIHSRFQKATTAKVPTFQPDFMLFDLTNSDTLSGTKQVGKS